MRVALFVGEVGGVGKVVLLSCDEAPRALAELASPLRVHSRGERTPKFLELLREPLNFSTPICMPSRFFGGPVSGVDGTK